MAGDDYELVSRGELEELRREVAQIKQHHPVQDFESSVSLIEAMDRLASQMSHLIRIFEHANKEMYDEYSKGFHEESRKLDKLIEQNGKMARGILAVADLVQNKKMPAPANEPSYPLRAEDEPIDAPVAKPSGTKRASSHMIRNEFR